ncbi:hypothetical protein J6590_031058 [Homalodisca vitripennis]|nr:hypothetical protein J6590_031058 [Homalodisca vitripennis]
MLLSGEILSSFLKSGCSLARVGYNKRTRKETLSYLRTSSQCQLDDQNSSAFSPHLLKEITPIVSTSNKFSGLSFAEELAEAETAIQKPGQQQTERRSPITRGGAAILMSTKPDWMIKFLDDLMQHSIKVHFEEAAKGCCSISGEKEWLSTRLQQQCRPHLLGEHQQKQSQEATESSKASLRKHYQGNELLTNSGTESVTGIHYLGQEVKRKTALSAV